MTTGENIRAWRKRRGLTQNQLGRLCGVSGAAIGSYEKGTTAPKRRTVEKIASALEVPPARLMEAGPPVPGRAPSDAPLYDGVLAALKELYGIVEGKVIVGENGAQRKYYVVRQISGDFILREDDIDAIVRSAKASMSPVAAYMRHVREQQATG